MVVVLNIGSLIDPTPFARAPGIQGIVLGFFCAVLLFAPLLQLPHLAIGGAMLLPLVAIPCILITVLSKVPVPERTSLLVKK